MLLIRLLASTLLVGRTRTPSPPTVRRSGTYTLTILPFSDPGEPIRASAVKAYTDARTGLDGFGHTAADEVRGACSGAPAHRNWLESGLAFVGDVVGVFEAVVDLGKLAILPMTLLNDLTSDLAALATGELTPEELATKYQPEAEDAQALFTAIKDHPGDVAIALGKAVLDWDTWADDPAKAIGHLIPDIVLAVATLGTGTLASAGSKGAKAGAEGVEAVESLVGAGSKLEDVTGVVTKMDDADAGAMPINKFPGSEAIASYAEKIPSKPGVYEVKLHGAPDLVEIAPMAGRCRRTSASSASSSHRNPTTPARTSGCSAVVPVPPRMASRNASLTRSAWPSKRRATRCGSIRAARQRSASRRRTTPAAGSGSCLEEVPAHEVSRLLPSAAPRLPAGPGPDRGSGRFAALHGPNRGGSLLAGVPRGRRNDPANGRRPRPAACERLRRQHPH